MKSISYYQNRIELLKSRPEKENNNIIRKIERKIRNLKK